MKVQLRALVALAACIAGGVSAQSRLYEIVPQRTLHPLAPLGQLVCPSDPSDQPFDAAPAKPLAAQCENIHAMRVKSAQCLDVAPETQELCASVGVKIKPAVLLLPASAVKARSQGQQKQLVLQIRNISKLLGNSALYLLNGPDQGGPCVEDEQIKVSVLKLFVVNSRFADLMCTASVVATNRLLTAAHCVDPDLQKTFDFSTDAGASELKCVMPQAYLDLPADQRQQCGPTTRGCDQDMAVCTRSDRSPFANTALEISKQGFSSGSSGNFAGFGLPNNGDGSMCLRNTIIRKAGDWLQTPDYVSLHFAQHKYSEAGPIENHDSGGPVIVGGPGSRTIVSVIVGSAPGKQISGRSLETKGSTPIERFLDCALRGPGPLPDKCP